MEGERQFEILIIALTIAFVNLFYELDDGLKDIDILNLSADVVFMFFVYSHNLLYKLLILLQEEGIKSFLQACNVVHGIY